MTSATKTPKKHRTPTVPAATKKLPNSWDLPDVVIFFNHVIGTKRLGTINTYDKAAETFYAKDQYVIADIISGEKFAIPISDVVAATMHKGETYPTLSDQIIDAWREYWEDHYQKANDALTKFGPGALFRIGVGDGHA